MPGLNDMMIKVQTLAGQIKKADERIDESKALRLRAEAALESAVAAEKDAIDNAAKLRTERKELAERVHEEIMHEGEPVITDELLTSAGLIKTDGGAWTGPGGSNAAPATGFPNAIFNGPDETRAEF